MKIIQPVQNEGFSLDTSFNQGFEDADNLDSRMISRLTDEMKNSKTQLNEAINLNSHNAGNAIELIKLQAKMATIANEVSLNAQYVAKGVKCIETLCKA